MRRALLIAVLVGCDASEQAAPVELGPPVYGSGVVRGAVLFEGAPPPRRQIPNRPCHDGAKPMLDEAVVVGEGGGLANVVVSLEGAAPSTGKAREPALLDQVDCRYVPHVVAVQVGQTLRVRSSDPALHNVHYKPAANAAANFGMSQPGQGKPVTFAAPETGITVKCDVHPWMTAYVSVFDHPFFATTGEDGAFTIERVPAGEYTLVAWHERFGRREQPVTVTDGGAVEARFEYKAP